MANLRSLRDYAARLTGVGAVEYVPDEFVRSGEVVLVDMPPEALRRRISSGAVFSADQVGGALADYFRASNLEALSELGERGWMELSKSWATTSSSAEDCYQNQRQSLSSLGILARCGVSGLSIAELKSRGRRTRSLSSSTSMAAEVLRDVEVNALNHTRT